MVKIPEAPLIRLHEVTLPHLREQRVDFLKRCSTAIPGGRRTAVLVSQPAEAVMFLQLLSGRKVPQEGRVEASLSLSPAAGTDWLCLPPSRSGRQNVTFMARILGLPVKEFVAAVESFSGMGAALDRPTASYSPRQRMRLGVALALVPSFDCYLLDWTRLGRDAEMRARCLDVLTNSRPSAGFVLCSNQPNLVRAHCEFVLVPKGQQLHLFDDFDEAIRFHVQR